MKRVLVTAVLMGNIVFADALEEGKKAFEHHDYLKAVERFGASCEGGNAKGCFELGKLYENGEGVAQNRYRASGLYAQACHGGEALGCSRMGLGFDTP